MTGRAAAVQKTLPWPLQVDISTTNISGRVKLSPKIEQKFIAKLRSKADKIVVSQRTSAVKTESFSLMMTQKMK